MRASERYLVKSYAIAVLNPGHYRLGWVMDISRGGLAMEYIPFGLQEERGNTEHADISVDLFIQGRSFIVASIPCALVYDKTIPDGFVFMLDAECRRCGIRFNRLESQQAEALDHFLHAHTIRPLQ